MLAKNKVNFWLWFSGFMVIFMVFWGGFTRLTNSGLSITEWRPVTGIIPPISNADWVEEYSKYSNTPEFYLLNPDITMKDFKFIYWVEYIHRIFGRLTFFVLVIPLFFLKKFISKKESYLMLIAIMLVCVQGFFGWYMVKSGIIDLPHVNHYRLALHLITALLIFSCIIEVYASFNCGDDYRLPCSTKFFIFLLTCQIFYGALTAGLGAGYIYNNFPLMGEGFMPEYLSNPFDDPPTVQFIHRLFAYIILLFAIYEFFKKNNNYMYKIGLPLLVSIQLCLGISVLYFEVPLVLSSLHQVNAFLTFGFAYVFGKRSVEQ